MNDLTQQHNTTTNVYSKYFFQRIKQGQFYYTIDIFLDPLMNDLFYNYFFFEFMVFLISDTLCDTRRVNPHFPGYNKRVFRPSAARKRVDDVRLFLVT